MDIIELAAPPGEYPDWFKACPLPLDG